MAKSQRDLESWEFNLESESSSVDSPRRLSRRRQDTSAGQLTLKRISDGLIIKKGTIIEVKQQASEESEIAIVKDVSFGNVNFIDLVVIWFLKNSDTQSTDDDRNQFGESEIYATEYRDEIKVNEIVKEVKIVSKEDFSQGMENVYVCRKGSDSQGEQFSKEFDFGKLLDMFMNDPNDYIDFIREETVPSAYKKKKEQAREKKPVKKKLDKPNKVDIKVEDEDSERLLSDEDSELDAKISSASDSDSDENLEPDTDDEYANNKSRKRGKVAGNKTPTRKKSKPRKLNRSDDEIEEDDVMNLKGSPRRRGRKAMSPSPSQAKLQLTDRKVINSMLSPLKKRLRLKGDLAKPSLSSSRVKFSPQQKLTVKRGTATKQIDLIDGPLSLDSSSEIFKELKAKLHTSMRLSSLPCREDEFTSIYLNLETAIQEQTGCCVYVSGTPGVGKTATIREVITQLKELIPTNEIRDFDYVEINGLKLLTPQVAYEILWEKVSGLNVSSSNAALLLESYFKVEEEDYDRKPLVVLMDELDQIVTKKQNVMYNFFNWPTYRYSKLIVIAVANTMDLPERVLSNKISSRLGLRRIQFIGYTYEQLGIIIKHRLDMIRNTKKVGGRKVVVNEDAVNFASRKVASVSGDARRALTICRRAVEIAENEFKTIIKDQAEDDNTPFHVSISHISKAINETINSPISQFLSALPFAHKLALVGVLLRIRRSGLAENSLGDILDEMKNSLLLLTSQIINHDEVSIVELLYGEGIITQANSNSNTDMNIRVLKFKSVINDLVDSGVLLQQNIKGERHRLIHLNVSEEEIITVLKRDKEINGML
ncbi:origin recognition complex subunit 1 [[Candida] railenensis]|uniref:Origin recognition complex subunit 1 n=1 Tax=[Candida] railenensis TaxID=45579 RepID=A0A9P0W1E7_9ASCO|nr:origin recognition complex subunit 1 [[Candida] railenensis]